jgi:FkbM family methyltransferase
MSPTATPRAVTGAFPFESVQLHRDAEIHKRTPLSFTTPARPWSYAISLPAVWPAAASLRQHEGMIRIRMTILEGDVSIMAIGASDSDVIDEARDTRTGAPIVVELAVAPLGECESIIIRNGAVGASRARIVVESIECLDLGPIEDADELAAPDGLALRPDADWPRFYGSLKLTVEERRRAARYARLKRVGTMPWLEQLRLRIVPNEHLSRALYVSGQYEPLTMIALRRALTPGAVFVDVGANVGLFSLVAARWVGPAGRVCSFEPSSREFARLSEHVRLNGLENITVIRDAVGRSAGSASLRVATYPDAGLNTLGRTFPYEGVATDRVEPVHVTTIDEFAAQQRLDRITAIKLDIEGSEIAALAGAIESLKHFRPVLFIEMSSRALATNGARLQDLLSALASAHFRVFRIGPSAELVALGEHDCPDDENVVALPDGESL